LRSEPLWLPPGQLIRLNQRLVAITGEPFLVTDYGLLESAWARQINAWHYGEDDWAVLAVSLMLGIARNHPFEQGNKRTGFAASVMFLNLNGLDLNTIDSEAFAETIIAAIERKIPDEALIRLIGADLIGFTGS